MLFEKPSKLYYQIKKILLSTMIAMVMFFNYAMFSQLFASSETNGSFTIEDFVVFETACNDNEEYYENELEDGSTKRYQCRILGFDETGSDEFEYTKTSDLFLGTTNSNWITGAPILTGNVLYYLTGKEDYLNSTSKDYKYTENSNDNYSLYKLFEYSPNWTFTNNYKYTLKNGDYKTFYSNSNPVDALYKYQETEKGGIEYSIYFDLSKLENEYIFTNNDFSGFINIDPSVNVNESYDTKVTEISNLFSYNYQLYSYMITHVTNDINGNNVNNSNNKTPYYNTTDKLYYIYNETEKWFDVYTFDSATASKWADSSQQKTLSNSNFYPLNKTTETYIKTNVRVYYNWDEYEYVVSSSESKTVIGGQLTKPADVNGTNIYTYYDNQKTDYFDINYEWSWEYLVPVWKEGLYFTTDWYENKTNAYNNAKSPDNTSINETDHTLEVNSTKTQGTYESIDTYNVETSVKTGTTSSINSKINNILYNLTGTQYEFKKITTANEYTIDDSSKQTIKEAKTISNATNNCSYGIGNGSQFVNTKCIFSKEDSGYRDYSVYKWASSYYFSTVSSKNRDFGVSRYSLSSTSETLPLGSTNSNTSKTAYLRTSDGYYYTETKVSGTRNIQKTDTYGWEQGSTGSDTINLLTNSDPNYSGNYTTGISNQVKQYTGSSREIEYTNGYYPYNYYTSSNYASSVPSTYAQYTQPRIDFLPTYYTQKSDVTVYSAVYNQYTRVSRLQLVYRKGWGTTSLSKYEGSVTVYAPTKLVLSTLGSYIPSSTTCTGHSSSCPFLIEKNSYKSYYGSTAVATLIDRITWYSNSSLTTATNIDDILNASKYRNVLIKSFDWKYTYTSGVNKTNQTSMNNTNYYNQVGFQTNTNSTGQYDSLQTAKNNIPASDNYYYYSYKTYNAYTKYNYKVWKLENYVTEGTSSSQGTIGFQTNGSNYKVCNSVKTKDNKIYNYRLYNWKKLSTTLQTGIYEIIYNGNVYAKSSTGLSSSTPNYSTMPALSVFSTSTKKYRYYWSYYTTQSLYKYNAYQKIDGGSYINTGQVVKELYSNYGGGTPGDGVYKYSLISGSTYYNWVIANTKVNKIYEYTNAEKAHTTAYYSSTPSNVNPSGNGTGSKYVSTGNVKYLYDIYERKITSTKNLYRYDSTWRDYSSSTSGWVSLGTPNYTGYSSKGSVNSTKTTLNSCASSSRGWNSPACYIAVSTAESQRINSRNLYKYNVFFNADKVLKEIKVLSTHKTTNSIKKNSNSTDTLNYNDNIPNVTDQKRVICSSTNPYNCYRLTNTKRSITEYFKYDKHIITYKTTAKKTSTISGLNNGYYDSGYIYKGTETINKVNANGTPTTVNVLDSFDWFKKASLSNVLKYYNGSQIILKNNANGYTHVNYSGQNKIQLKPNTTYTFTINGYKDNGIYGKARVILPNENLDYSNYAIWFGTSASTQSISFTTDSTGQVSIGFYITTPNQNGKVYINWMQITEGSATRAQTSYKTYSKQSTRTNTYYEYFHFNPTYNYYLDNENPNFAYEIKTKIVKYTLKNGNVITNTGSNDEFEKGFTNNYINNNINMNSIMIGYDFNKDGTYSSNEYWYCKNTPTQWVTAATNSSGIVTQKYKSTSIKNKYYYSTSRQVVLEKSTNSNYFTSEDYTSKIASEGDIVVNFNNITASMINNMSKTGSSTKKVLYNSNYYPEDSEIAKYSLLLDYMKSNGIDKNEYKIVYNATTHKFYYYDDSLRAFYQHKIYIDSNKDSKGNKLDKGYTIEVLTQQGVKDALSGTTYFNKKDNNYNYGYATSLNNKNYDSMLDYISSVDPNNQYGLLLHTATIDYANTKYLTSNNNSYKIVLQDLSYHGYVESKTVGYWETGAVDSINNDLFNPFSGYVSNNASLFVFILDINGVEKYIPVWANNYETAETKAYDIFKSLYPHVLNVYPNSSNVVIVPVDEVYNQMKITNNNKLKITNLKNDEVYIEISNYFSLNGSSEYLYELTKTSTNFMFTNHFTLDSLDEFYMDDNALGSSWNMYDNNIKEQNKDFSKTFEKSLQYSLTKINDSNSNGFKVHFNGMHNYWFDGKTSNYLINGGSFTVGSSYSDNWIKDTSSVFNGFEKNATINSKLFTSVYNKGNEIILGNKEKDIPEIIMVKTGTRKVNFYNNPAKQNAIELISDVNSYDTYALYAINYKGKIIYYKDYIQGLEKVLTKYFEQVAKNQGDSSYFFNNSNPNYNQNKTFWTSFLTEEEFDLYAPVLYDAGLRESLKNSSFLNLVFDGSKVYTYNASDSNLQDIMKNAFTSKKYTDSNGKETTNFVYDELYYKGGLISPILAGASYDSQGRISVRHAHENSNNMSGGILGDSYIPYFETMLANSTDWENYSSHGTRVYTNVQLPIPISNFDEDYNNGFSIYNNYQNAEYNVLVDLTVQNMMQAIISSWDYADKELLYVNSGIEDLSLVYRKLSNTDMIRDQFTNTINWGSKFNNGAVYGNLMYATDYTNSADMFLSDFRNYGSVGYVATLGDYVPQNYLLDNNNSKMKAFEIEFSSNNFNTGSGKIFEVGNADYGVLLLNDALGTSGIDVRSSFLNTYNSSGKAIPESNNGSSKWADIFLDHFENKIDEKMANESVLDYSYVFNHVFNSNFYFFTFYSLDFDLNTMQKNERSKPYNVLPSEFATTSTGYYYFWMGSYLSNISPSRGLVASNSQLPYILDCMSSKFENDTHANNYINDNYLTTKSGIFYPKLESLSGTKMFDSKILFGYILYEDENLTTSLTNSKVHSLRINEIDSIKNYYNRTATTVFYGLKETNISYSYNYRLSTLVAGSYSEKVTKKTITLYMDLGTKKDLNEDIYTKYTVSFVSSDSDGTKGNTSFEMKINLGTKNNYYGIQTTHASLGYEKTVSENFQNYELKIYYLTDKNKPCATGYIKNNDKCYLTDLGYQPTNYNFDSINNYNPYVYTLKFYAEYEVFAEGENELVTETQIEYVDVFSEKELTSYDLSYIVARQKEKLTKKYSNTFLKDSEWIYDSYKMVESTDNVEQGYWNIVDVSKTDNGVLTINSIIKNLLPETEYYIAARLRFKNGSVSSISYSEYQNDSFSTVVNKIETLENYKTPSVAFGQDMVNNPYGSISTEALIKSCSSGNSICSGDELLSNKLIPVWLNEVIFSVPKEYETILKNSSSEKFKNIMNKGYTAGFENFTVKISSLEYDKLSEGEKANYTENKDSYGNIINYSRVYSVSNLYRLHISEIRVTGAKFKIFEVNSKTGKATVVPNITGQLSFIKGNNPSLKNSNNTTKSVEDGIFSYDLSDNDYIAKSTYSNDLVFINDYLLNEKIFNILVTNSNLSTSDKVYRIMYSNKYGEMYSFIDYDFNQKLSSNSTLSGDYYDEYGVKITKEELYDAYKASFYDESWNYEYDEDGSIAERKFIVLDNMVFFGHVRNGQVDTIITG